MFLKKEAEEERKKMLKEKRNLRKQLLEVQQNDGEALSDVELKSKADDMTTEDKPAKEENERGRGRGGFSGRGRGRWGRRGRGRWTHRC